MSRKKKTEKKRKTPSRTCLGCGQIKDKKELIRIVRNPELKVEVDLSGKANGRGTYFCRDANCLNVGLKKDKLYKALKVNIELEEQERLKNEINRILSET